jgi:iron complex transport system substrate-binding protein
MITSSSRSPAASVSPYNVRVPHSHRPVRIACLQPSATVILASVGALDRVVACTKYCAEVVPELDVTRRLVIADSWTAKTSEILAVDPDLVIASVPYQQTSVAEILKAGVRFLGLAPHTLEDIYTDIWTIAACAGVSERADKILVDMQASIEDIHRRALHLPKKRVFCEEWGKPIIASQPWVAELIAAAGGEFIGIPGKPCSSDDVARLDPEVIIAAWCGAGNRVPLDKIIRERNWSGTTASKTCQVYCISDELLNTPAPTLIAGLHALTAAIHPEIFGGDANATPGLRQITELQPAQLNRGGLV